MFDGVRRNALANTALVVLPVLVAFSFLSYQIIERPFLRLRVRYLAEAAPAPAPAPAPDGAAPVVPGRAEAPLRQ